MKKSIFKFVMILLLCCCGSALIAANLSPQQPKAGKQYVELTKKLQTELPSHPGKVTVTEFFSYGCPACYYYEPYIEKWLKNKPSYVVFQRFPVVDFSADWNILAKAFFAAQSLGVLDKVTPVFFQKIHGQEPLEVLNTPEKLAAFFKKYAGVSQADFDSAFNFSPAIDAQLNKVRQYMHEYKVFQIPTIVVDGKYRTNPSMAGGKDGSALVKVINFLVAKEYKAMGIAKKNK